MERRKNHELTALKQTVKTTIKSNESDFNGIFSQIGRNGK